MCINKVVRDRCNCIHHEKEHCQLGDQAGVSTEQCEGNIVMPGEYVAILAFDPGMEFPPDDDWGIYVDVVPALDNLKTLATIAGASAGAC